MDGAGLRALVGVLRVQELERDAGPRELAVDACPVGVGVHRPGVAPAGEQQRVGGLLGHPLDVLPGDAPLPRGFQHVLDAVLRDVGGAGDRVLRQSVHRPQPQDLPGPILLAMWNLFVHGRPSVTGMRGEAFNGGAERQYSVRWGAVLIRNIDGVERA